MSTFDLSVSVHTLMSARDCRTRLALHLAGLEDAGTPPPGGTLSRVAGQWGHKAMAAWLSGGDWQAAFADYATVSSDLSADLDRRGYSNMQRVVASVVARHEPLDRLPFDLLDAKTTEVGFAVPLGELRSRDGDLVRVNLIGYIDKIVRDKQSGRKMPLEHKFTGKMDAAFAARFQNYDPQVTAYILATAATLGEPVIEAWVNGIEMAMVPTTADRKCPKHGVPYSECGPDGTIREPHVRQAFISAKRAPAQIAEFRLAALDACKRYVLPVALALRKRGAAVATKTPRDGIFTRACDYCEFARWCLTSNRGPSMMGTMLQQVKHDDSRLRSGLVEVTA